MAASIWAALLIVYVVWGSTYLAIRIAIETLPPFLGAGVRFLVAGGVLYLWAVRRGDRVGDAPGRREWGTAAIVGAGLFLGGNGGVVFAESRIASGVAALLVATLSLWMPLLAWAIYGERPPRAALIGLPIGFLGTALLIGPVDAGGIDPIGALACLGGAISWAAASLYSRHARLPARTQLSTAMQMLAGSVWLMLAGLLTGELSRVRPETFSWASLAALAYLIVAGSLVAFSAYAWLLRVAPTPLVATYAYVNPVVAVLLGWAVVGEPITPRMVVAGGIILTALALIANGTRRAPAPRLAHSNRIESTTAPRSGSSRAKSAALVPTSSVTDSEPSSAG
jgi:drug/metabolite transporter (DMT)-like permease